MFFVFLGGRSSDACLRLWLYLCVLSGGAKAFSHWGLALVLKLSGEMGGREGRVFAQSIEVPVLIQKWYQRLLYEPPTCCAPHPVLPVCRGSVWLTGR